MWAVGDFYDFFLLLQRQEAWTKADLLIKADVQFSFYVNFLADEGMATCLFAKQVLNLLKVVHCYDFFVNDLAQFFVQKFCCRPMSLVLSYSRQKHCD